MERRRSGRRRRPSFRGPGAEQGYEQGSRCSPASVPPLNPALCCLPSLLACYDVALMLLTDHGLGARDLARLAQTSKLFHAPDITEHAARILLARCGHRPDCERVQALLAEFHSYKRVFGFVSRAQRCYSPVGAAWYHTAVIDQQGRVVTFGRKREWACGRESGPEPLPPRVADAFPTAVGVAAAEDATLVLTANGRLFCVGVEERGEFGLGTGFQVCERPVMVRQLGVHVVGVSCGGQHTLVLDDRGRAQVFGCNLLRQLGLDGRVRAAHEPTLLRGISERLVAVAAGAGHSLFLTCSGRVFSCGANHNGQLGRGLRPGEPPAGEGAAPPMLGPGGLAAVVFGREPRPVVVAVSAGYNTSAFVAEGGALFMCGAASHGQTGRQASLEPQTEPLAVLATHSFVSVSCGGSHTIAVTSAGLLVGWGRNHVGQLGPPPAAEDADDSQRPAVIGLGPALVAHAAAGLDHTMAVTETGALISFGSNTFGQLGRPGTVGSRAAWARPKPVRCPSVLLPF